MLNFVYYKLFSVDMAKKSKKEGSKKCQIFVCVFFNPYIDMYLKVKNKNKKIDIKTHGAWGKIESPKIINNLYI